MRYGPRFLFCGSHLTDDTYVMRVLLEGLNTMGRQWGETIVIQDDGSLEGLEHECEDHKYLEHRPVKEWSDPNIVFAFIDRMRQNRSCEQTLVVADTHKRPAFIISTYDPTRSP